MKVTDYTPTKVVTSYQKADGEGNIILECHMDNGSIWQCDTEGANWKKIKKGDNELTHLFDAWNGPPEKV